MAKSLEGSTSCQPELLESSEHETPDTEVVGQTISCVVDLNAVGGEGSCPETQQQQAVVGGSVIVVEPGDFLLGNIHTIKFNIPATMSAGTHVISEDVCMSSILLDAESVKKDKLNSS